MIEHGRGVVLLDGGMGTELVRRRGVPPTPLFSAEALLEAPALVRAVHEDFKVAGARVLTVNSYALTPQRLARDGDPAALATLIAAALDAAAQARDGDDVRIAGCLPPLVASYRADLVPADAVLAATYARLADLQAAAVDLFIAETMSAIREGVAATTAAAASGRPVWCAFTVADDAGAKLRSGEPVAAAAAAAMAAGAEAVLVNCSTPEAVDRAVEAIAPLAIPFGGYANGFVEVDALAPGGSIEGLQRRLDLTPETYADHALRWVDAGAAIVGGCCEVGPAHIRCLRERLEGLGMTIEAGLVPASAAPG